jgi:hypothetical protein
MCMAPIKARSQGVADLTTVGVATTSVGTTTLDAQWPRSESTDAVWRARMKVKGPTGVTLTKNAWQSPCSMMTMTADACHATQQQGPRGRYKRSPNTESW